MAGDQRLAASALTELTEFAPSVLHVSLARSLFCERLFNVTITNVLAASRVCVWRGDDRRRADRAAGGRARVRDGRRSYAGGMTFGLYVDRATVPDLDVIRNGIVTSLLELAALRTRHRRHVSLVYFLRKK